MKNVEIQKFLNPDVINAIGDDNSKLIYFNDREIVCVDKNKSIIKYVYREKTKKILKIERVGIFKKMKYFRYLYTENGNICIFDTRNIVIMDLNNGKIEDEIEIEGQIVDLGFYKSDLFILMMNKDYKLVLKTDHEIVLDGIDFKPSNYLAMQILKESVYILHEESNLFIHKIDYSLFKSESRELWKLEKGNGIANVKFRQFCINECNLVVVMHVYNNDNLNISEHIVFDSEYNKIINIIMPDVIGTNLINDKINIIRFINRKEFELMSIY
nr:hypothetical protein [Armatimonas sp.]